MSEWIERRLREVCSRLSSGSNITAKDIHESGNFPVFGGNGIRGYAAEANFSGECAIIGRQGAYCGNVRYFIGEARMTEHAIVACAGPSHHTRFLAYLLSNMNLGSLSGQAAQPGLSVKVLAQQSVRMPSRQNQERIAVILGAYDDLIEVNRRRVAVLEEMARGLFEEWFVRFRFPGHECVSIVDTPEGPLPAGWTTRLLANLCDRITDGAHRSPPSVERGRPMASVRDMRDWGFDYSACRMISVAEWNELERSDCRPLVGDILIAKDGANLNKHTFLVWREEPVVLLSSVAIIRPATYVQREFVTAVLRSPGTDAAIKNMKSGAAIPRVVLKDFKRLPIIWPSDHVRDEFERFIHPIHQQCRVLLEANRRLIASRDLLLPRLISGQLSVNAAERDLELAA